MKAAFYTFGCKVNQYETQSLIGAFSAAGFTIGGIHEACDVYVVNSCTVTAEGDSKVRKLLRRLRREHPDALLALTGCYAQAFSDIAALVPEADVITGSYNRAALLPAVQKALAERAASDAHARVVEITPHTPGEPFESMSASSFLDHDGRERTRAFIKIQDGCERYCAYCIIPTARGPFRSKPLSEIGTELCELAGHGYKEVVLVGINLSCYGVDCGLHLYDAVELACRYFGRVRLSSLEPELLGPEVVERMSRLPELCPQFHLSLQSGCDATLRRMNRHYTAGQYREIVEDLRAHFPRAAITTDVMVGFPGETEQEFEESLRFCRELSLAKAHVFAYSRRPGTVADTMPDQVSEQEKNLRSRRMIEATDESRRAFLAAQVGSVHTVLLERETAPDCYSGYTENYTPVLVEGRGLQGGQLVRVRLTQSDGTVCRASVGEEDGKAESANL